MLTLEENQGSVMTGKVGRPRIKAAELGSAAGKMATMASFHGALGRFLL
jgi:hypothetical protein